MEIVPGIHWLDLGRVNVYLSVAPGELVLIDSGAPRSGKAILDYLDQLGFQPADLGHIVLTHADLDHAGSARWLQEQSGAIVYAAAATAACLERGQAPRHTPLPLHLMSTLLMRFYKIPGEDVQVVEAGEKLPLLGGLLAINAPGHTHDHHAFYSPTEGVLFCGDALTTREGELGLMPDMMTADSELARITARRLMALAPAVFACGHGPPLHSHEMGDLMRILRNLG